MSAAEEAAGGCCWLGAGGMPWRSRLGTWSRAAAADAAAVAAKAWVASEAPGRAADASARSLAPSGASGLSAAEVAALAPWPACTSA